VEGRVRVLIVDDDIGFRETLADILGEKGCQVSMAQDGLQALRMIERETFDVVLMDVRMPMMDGVETYKAVKKRHPQLPVIMITAYAADEHVNESLREGAYGVIYKPLDIERTLSLMKDATRPSPSPDR